ncbi:MAG: hypothetical protein PHC62_00055 [Candidatus Izemoplasmatales bacterium]|nr:hypothetical protein [Candidatus Izemoplasmatales bacterium]
MNDLYIGLYEKQLKNAMKEYEQETRILDIMNDIITARVTIELDDITEENLESKVYHMDYEVINRLCAFLQGDNSITRDKAVIYYFLEAVIKIRDYHATKRGKITIPTKPDYEVKE